LFVEALVSNREPILHPIPLKDLRPTQITVGYREVAEKRRQWRERKPDDLPEFLGRHMIPVVLGPKDRHYVIDHHHLCRALMEEDVQHILVNVVADIRALKRSGFWVFMDNRAWCHPYDDEGKRRDFDAIPKSILEMKDDPYRSLAGELRRAGGFSKETTPFAEFIWADFLRHRIKTSLVQHDFPAAMTRALTLAKGKDANCLPGWCGPDPTS
jgi:hypothetical protein